MFSCLQNSATIGGPQYSVQRLSERFDVVNMREASRAAENVFIENEAFLEMKDEDLWFFFTHLLF